MQALQSTVPSIQPAPTNSGREVHTTHRDGCLELDDVNCAAVTHPQADLLRLPDHVKLAVDSSPPDAEGDAGNAALAADVHLCMKGHLHIV